MFTNCKNIMPFNTQKKKNTQKTICQRTGHNAIFRPVNVSCMYKVFLLTTSKEQNNKRKTNQQIPYIINMVNYVVHVSIFERMVLLWL